jgi:hypothetical protein
MVAILPLLELVLAAISLKECGGFVLLPIETTSDVRRPAAKAIGQSGGDSGDDAVLRVLEPGGVGVFAVSHNVMKAVLLFGGHGCFG